MNLPKPKLYAFIILIAALVVLSFIISVYILFSRPKVAVVRSLDLIYEYNGMKEARSLFKVQADAWKSNLDTLHIKYQSALSEYQAHYASYNISQREEQQKMLATMEQNLNKYADVINKEAKAEEQEKTQAVLNQINSHIQEYAKRKGYDVVLGADGSGSVLYGSDAFDITDEVLRELNNQYKIMPDSKSK